MNRALAIDLGATSGRYAIGTLQDGRISFEVVEQIPHGPTERNGRLEWDLDALLGLAQRGLRHAADSGCESIGIDSWGVDLGFLGHDGSLIVPPVAYRDPSHTRAFEMLASHRDRLYELTGIQHQPFNTIYQLLARRLEDPTLPERCREWMILPDLLGYLLGGGSYQEITEASTTQLLGLDNRWCKEAFEIVGWPVPSSEPALPGTLGPKLMEGVRLAHVGSHDTASAVAGFGALQEDQIFVNVGTWSLAGTVVDRPIANADARAEQFTNERTVDGCVRLLKNIPGFWVVNRLHEELGIARSVPEWLGSATEVTERIDLLHSDFYNPDSMRQSCLNHASAPTTQEGWAGLVLSSLAATVAGVVKPLSRLTGREFRSFRVGGGGSQSAAFCQALARESGLEVLAGPAEVTVLGNLAAQFLALGAFANWHEAFESVGRSAEIVRYSP